MPLGNFLQYSCVGEVVVVGGTKQDKLKYITK